jgi:hypothetical protein
MTTFLDQLNIIKDVVINSPYKYEVIRQLFYLHDLSIYSEGSITLRNNTIVNFFTSPGRFPDECLTTFNLLKNLYNGETTLEYVLSNINI